jgi:hypothetical protein
MAPLTQIQKAVYANQTMAMERESVLRAARVVAKARKELLAKVQAALPGSTLERKMRPTRVAYIVKRGSDFDEANTGDLSRALDLAGGQRGTKTNFGEAARKAKAKGGR